LSRGRPIIVSVEVRDSAERRVVGEAGLISGGHDSVELPHEGPKFSCVPFEEVNDFCLIRLRPSSVGKHLRLELLIKIENKLGHVREYLITFVD